MLQSNRRSLFSLYLAYFADYFSWGAAITFIYVYVSSETTSFNHLIWNEEFSLALGLAANPIGEVAGSPILGDLSDWIGRKKVLIWGLWGSIASMALCAYSLYLGSFLFFVLCQFLIGFFSGKQAMAQAAIVETHAGGKGQKLAFLSVLGGIAWILGPFLGGILMEDPFTSHGGYIWPSLLALAVYVITLVFTHYYYTDTYEPPENTFVLGKFLHSVGETFLLTFKERVFFVFLLNLLGWYLLAISLSDFLLVRFHLAETQIGTFNSYLSLCFTLGGVIGTAWVLHHWKAKNILFWCLLTGSIGLFLLFGADKVSELWTYLAIPALTEAWIYPAYQTVLSDRASDKGQGKLFGLIGASNGACQFVTSIILTDISSQTSILIAALLFLSSAAILPLLIRKKVRQGFPAGHPQNSVSQ